MDLATIGKIIELIESHGLSLVLLILLLVTFVIPWVVKMQKYYESGRNEGHEESEYIDEIIDLESGIIESLGQLAVEMDGQWATLWQFHNGTSSVDGVPFVKMSITHEFTAGSVRPRFELYQGIPISVFVDAITAIRVEGYLEVDSSSQFKSLVNSYKRDGINHAILIPVKNTAGKMVGILSVAYSKARRVSHTEERKQAMQNSAIGISIQLSQLASFRKRLTRRKDDTNHIGE